MIPLCEILLLPIMQILSGLLKFRGIVELHTCLFFYGRLCKNKPSNFAVALVSEQHNYFTRGACAQPLLIPFSRINMRKFCPTVIGKYYWNALPVCIRDLTTKTSFRKALRKYDLAQCYKSVFGRIQLVFLCLYLMFVSVPCVSWLCVILCNKSYRLNYICFKGPN